MNITNKKDIEEIKNFNFFSGSLKKITNEVKLLIDMVSDPKFELGFTTKMLIISTLLYIISPGDLVPDILPIIGWSDDIALVLGIVREISSDIERYQNFLKIRNIVI